MTANAAAGTLIPDDEVLDVGALIREIGLKSALVPRFPGITSALGCVLADLRHDMVQTVNLMLDNLQALALEVRMSAAGTSGHRGCALDSTFNEDHIVAITEAICRYRRTAGITGPLFIGRDTHAVSEPAFQVAGEGWPATTSR